MSLVLIESPYSGNIPRNIAYAQRAMVDSRLLGEVPIVSHLLWTQHPRCPQHFVADDSQEYVVIGREKSLQSIETIRRKVDKVIFYTDYGFSSGMNAGMKQCVEENIPYETRTLGNTDEDTKNAANRQI